MQRRLLNAVTATSSQDEEPEDATGLNVLAKNRRN